MYYESGFAAIGETSYSRVKKMQKRMEFLTFFMFSVWEDVNKQISMAKILVRALLMETSIWLMCKNIEKPSNLQLVTANIYNHITYIIDNDELKGVFCVVYH